MNIESGNWVKLRNGDYMITGYVTGIHTYTKKVTIAKAYRERNGKIDRESFPQMTYPIENIVSVEEIELSEFDREELKQLHINLSIDTKDEDWFEQLVR